MNNINFFLFNSFGEVIKKAREKSKMTQKQLAEKCGIGAIYISRIENELNKIPSDETCLKLAEVLNIEPKFLFQLAHYLRTPSQFRKFFSPSEELIEISKEKTKKVVDDPSIKTLLFELSNSDLPSDVWRRLLESWVKGFLGTLEILRERQKESLGTQTTQK